MHLDDVQLSGDGRNATDYTGHKEAREQLAANAAPVEPPAEQQGPRRVRRFAQLCHLPKWPDPPLRLSRQLALGEGLAVTQPCSLDGLQLSRDVALHVGQRLGNCREQVTACYGAIA